MLPPARRTPVAGRLLAALLVLGTASGCAQLPEAQSSAQSSDQASDPSSAPAAPAVTPSARSAGRTPAPGATPAPAAPRGTALDAVDRLRVGGRSPLTGYSREAFGQAWYDADRNGCDTRNDVLRRDLVDRVMKNACKVLAGTRDPDPYTGRTIRFEYAGASELDVDHVVALGDAWQKGADRWGPAERLALANDPLNLLAVDASANRAKGDGDAATWLPSSKPFRCAYVARQVAVKQKYDLRVTPAEHDAMVRVLGRCDATALPGPGTAPTRAPLPRTRAAVPAPEASAQGAPAVVHPGSYCTPVGAVGVTTAGTVMGCSTRPGDDRARWRSR